MRIGRDTTYGLVAAGKIPAIRLGRQIRIPRSALLAQLERLAEREAEELANEQAPPAAPWE